MPTYRKNVDLRSLSGEGNMYMHCLKCCNCHHNEPCTLIAFFCILGWEIGWSSRSCLRMVKIGNFFLKREFTCCSAETEFARCVASIHDNWSHRYLDGLCRITIGVISSFQRAKNSSVQNPRYADLLFISKKKKNFPLCSLGQWPMSSDAYVQVSMSVYKI